MMAVDIDSKEKEQFQETRRHAIQSLLDLGMADDSTLVPQLLCWELVRRKA